MARGPASDIPDDVFSLVNLRERFDGLSGAGNIPEQIVVADINKYVPILDSKYQVCGGNMNCLAPYTTDRRIQEKTVAPYIQVNTKFDMFQRPAHVVVGVRYEKTDIDSSALVPVPGAVTSWGSANEFSLDFSGGNSSFTTLKAHYQNLLPNIDFDFRPMDNVVIRASTSTTITRPDYASMQGGQTLDQGFRIGGGTGSQGNPGLLPYKSKNLDLSAEWYYGKDSYVSLGYFHKDVSNFITNGRASISAFGLTNPGSGPRYRAAIAALGPNAATVDIRQYIFDHYPNSVVKTGYRLHRLHHRPDPQPARR
ncbi:MAG: TonB-dependent receptor [Asticcacaulis sp.]